MSFSSSHISIEDLRKGMIGREHAPKPTVILDQPVCPACPAAAYRTTEGGGCMLGSCSTVEDCPATYECLGDSLNPFGVCSQPCHTTHDCPTDQSCQEIKFDDVQDPEWLCFPTKYLGPGAHVR